MDEWLTVGKKYDVMTLMTGRDYLANDGRTYRIVNLLGIRGVLPLIYDESHPFPGKAQIDLRFLTPNQFRVASDSMNRWGESGLLLTFDNDVAAAAMKPERLRMICQRNWPEMPAALCA